MIDRDHGKDSAVDFSHAAQRARDLGRGTASWTSDYVREGLERAADYAQSLSHRASDQITDLTGRPAAVWMRELRRFVEHSPLKAVAAAVAVGYVLGRAARRNG